MLEKNDLKIAATHISARSAHAEKVTLEMLRPLIDAIIKDYSLPAPIWTNRSAEVISDQFHAMVEIDIDDPYGIIVCVKLAGSLLLFKRLIKSRMTSYIFANGFTDIRDLH